VRSSRPIVLAALMAVTLLVIGGAGTALAAPPPNDNLASATPITSLPFSDTVDTTDATTDETPACDFSTIFPKSVWYSFTPSTSGPVVIDTADSSYTVGGTVLTGSPGSFSTVTCFPGQGSFVAEAGQTYRVGLVDFGSVGGTLRLSVTPPPPPTLSFASTGTLGVLGSSASVPVTYTCSPADSTIFEATLLQRRGKRRIRLNTVISDPATCDGLPHSTTAVFQNFGPFALTKGKATITPLIGWMVAVNVGPQQIRLRK
jgi:hypothetical protein